MISLRQQWVHQIMDRAVEVIKFRGWNCICLLALLQMQISWRSRKSPVAKDPYQSRDIYRSKRLSHPFCWAGNVIARFDHGRLRISAESVINIILDAISSNLHTLNFASSVSTAAGFRTVLPAFRLPTRNEEERKSVIKWNVVCDEFRIIDFRIERTFQTMSQPFITLYA